MVPVELGMNRSPESSKVPVHFRAEVRCSVIKPDDTMAFQWNFRLFIIPAVAATKSSWMQ
jgi:hypothetical protein